MNLPIEVMLAISVISSVLVFLLRLLFTSKGKVVPAWVYTVFLYVVSLGVAAVFFPLQLPPFPPYSDLPSGLVSLLAWLVALIPILSAFVGTATVIYQIILKRVLDGIANIIRKAFDPSVGSDIG